MGGKTNIFITVNMSPSNKRTILGLDCVVFLEGRERGDCHLYNCGKNSFNSDENIALCFNNVLNDSLENGIAKKSKLFYISL